MDVPVTVTSGTLLSLAASTALRQLSTFGVKARELESLRYAIQDEVDEAEDSLRAAMWRDIEMLRTIPEGDGEDRGQAEFVLMLSGYAEYGVRVACKIYRQRLAEAN